VRAYRDFLSSGNFQITRKGAILRPLTRRAGAAPLAGIKFRECLPPPSRTATVLALYGTDFFFIRNIRADGTYRVSGFVSQRPLPIPLARHAPLCQRSRRAEGLQGLLARRTIAFIRRSSLYVRRKRQTSRARHFLSSRSF